MNVHVFVCVLHLEIFGSMTFFYHSTKAKHLFSCAGNLTKFNQLAFPGCQFNVS